MTQKPDTALAVRNTRIELWRDPEWQRLWLALRAKPWRSLSLIPAGPGAPADFTLRIATTLARTAMVHLGGPVQVADASRIPLAYLAQFMEEVRLCTKDGEVVFVALPSTQDSPVAVPIAQATDAALLCVLLERMRSSGARKTLSQVGQQRFVGSAVFHGSSLTPAGAPGPQRPPEGT